jgi:hypothetical protein
MGKKYKVNPVLCENKDIEFDEDDIKAIVKKELKTRDFEKAIKKIVSQCFIDFNLMLYNNRNFLKNQL